MRGHVTLGIDLLSSHQLVAYKECAKVENFSFNSDSTRSYPQEYKMFDAARECRSIFSVSISQRAINFKKPSLQLTAQRYLPCQGPLAG